MADGKKLKKAMKNFQRKHLSKDRKSTLITIRAEPFVKRRLEDTAKSLDMSLSEFVLQTCLYAADRLEKEGKK